MRTLGTARRDVHDAIHATPARDPFALAGYGGALLAHPGGQIGGIAAAAMGASVLIVIAYAVARWPLRDGASGS